MQEAGSRWRQDLEHGFRRLQFDVDAVLAAASTRTEEALQESLTTWTPERGETLGRELDDAVDALAGGGHRRARPRRGARREFLVTIAEQGVDVARPELTLPVPDRAPTRRVQARGRPHGARRRGRARLVRGRGGAAFGAERLLMPLGLLLGIGGLGLGAAIGIAGIALRRRTMERVREQRAAQRLATRTLAEARAQTQREFAKHLYEVRYGLESTVTELLAARRRELGDAIARGQAGMRQGAAERGARTQEIEQALAALARLASTPRRCTRSPPRSTGHAGPRAADPREAAWDDVDHDPAPGRRRAARSRPGGRPRAVGRLIRAMDAGDLEGVGGLLGELAGPEEFAAQVVSLASLARLLLDQIPQTGPENDEARTAVLSELARVLVAAETPDTD